jgi:hypothetical protein
MGTWRDRRFGDFEQGVICREKSPIQNKQEKGKRNEHDGFTKFE